MKPTNRFVGDMLDLETPEAAGDVLWRACKPIAAEEREGAIIFQVPFQAQKPGLQFVPDERTPRQVHALVVRAYGPRVVRLSIAFSGQVPGDESVMLERDPALVPEPLRVRQDATGWEVTDTAGTVRLRVITQEEPIRPWSDLIEPPAETLRATVYPDGATAVPFMAYDGFFPRQQESLPLAYITRESRPHRVAYSLHALPDEKFAGTGERFARMDLAGGTYILENTDALGVNNRRAYKNVPFYLSSRPYGLLILTSAHVRLSLADISTRAAQGLVEDDTLDLFFIGGPNLERILYTYRQLTGFPRTVPLWSFGIWMSRMSYWTAEETREVARKLRAGGFPCDVLHLDTGWFQRDWKCDWEFSHEKYPDPAAYLREMRQNGFRISLWQMPNISQDNKLYPLAKEHRYIVPKRAAPRHAPAEAGGGPAAAPGGSDFSGQEYAGTLDFTNPAAVRWYQGLLEKLLKLGAAAIKTDFGEEIDMAGDYYGLPAHLLHNLYALLYQKAAFEITQQTTGEGLIWARAGWVGCQRYPVHWGGDAACTWDGMAGTLRGGLHLGLSGFAFWSHDVPGFHGVPNFMNSWPADDLYVRWTQLGVFTSHLRYHGAQPREPYEYPQVADVVRRWWRLRYALIPYLADQAERAIRSGLPILRALILHHEDDPLCWQIDDQFYCGDALLVAPVMNSEGRRDVYLPQGEWVDLWTGETLQGPRWLKGTLWPLERLPVYAVRGASIRVYPHVVQCTDEMDLRRAVPLTFDAPYRGLSRSVLGQVSGL